MVKSLALIVKESNRFDATIVFSFQVQGEMMETSKFEQTSMSKYEEITSKVVAYSMLLLLLVAGSAVVATLFYIGWV